MGTKRLHTTFAPLLMAVVAVGCEAVAGFGDPVLGNPNGTGGAGTGGSTSSAMTSSSMGASENTM